MTRIGEISVRSKCSVGQWRAQTWAWVINKPPQNVAYPYRKTDW